MITAILEADAEGTLHLPVPADWRKSKLKVTAIIEAAHGNGSGGVADWPARRETALAALQRIRERGGIRSIPDPVAWQREQRQDRLLPGRE